MNATLKKQKYNNIAYLLILPTFIFLGIFSFYPIFLAITKSLYRWSGTFNEFGINEFIAFDNYVTLFKDELYRKAWLNALFFIATGVVINLVFPFTSAYLINGLKGERSRYLLRVLLVVPMVVPGVVVFLLWQFIYKPDVGVIAQFLKLFGKTGVDILGSTGSVKWGIRMMGFPWVGGLYFLVYYAALSNIDSAVKEAAIIDGAGPMRVLFRIVIPLMMSQFKMIFTLTVIGEVQDYVKIQTLTGGGPGFASYVPGLYIYDVAFTTSNGYGLACAGGVVMLAVMLILNFAGNKLFKTEEY